MNHPLGLTRGTTVALAVSALLASPAGAATGATVVPRLAPDRLGARAALAVSIGVAGTVEAIPSPLRGLTLRFPAGMTLDVPRLSSCPVARLRAHGRGGCPSTARLGSGTARVEALLGSQRISERISLWLFLGPLRNLQPTVVVLGRGYTPFDKRVLLTGLVPADTAPFGERLELSIPPIPTLPLEPDASIVSLSLTVGGRASGSGPHHIMVRVPTRCPAGGFPVAGEFQYADGSASVTRAAIPCPSEGGSR